jgi:hypothetical protein
MSVIRTKHYWRKALREKAPRAVPAVLQPPQCDAQHTLNLLSKVPQPSLSWFDRFVAFLTTPFKRVGISGWKETGCMAAGEGVPVRTAQHSTDGFWTIDLKLVSLAIGATTAPPERYLRLEVEPETLAHSKCEQSTPTPASHIRFGGAVVIDTDGPFLEIHPEDDFNISAAEATKQAVRDGPLVT